VVAGATRRQHLLGAWRNSGRRPDALDTPAPPDALAYLFDWFLDLAVARSAGMSEPAPIAWAELQAWAQLHGRVLRPWQAQLLRTLDRLWIDTWRAGRPKAAAPRNDDDD
jgi:hypothetical protein